MFLMAIMLSTAVLMKVAAIPRSNPRLLPDTEILSMTPDGIDSSFLKYDA